MYLPGGFVRTTSFGLMMFVAYKTQPPPFDTTERTQIQTIGKPVLLALRNVLELYHNLSRARCARTGSICCIDNARVCRPLAVR